MALTDILKILGIQPDVVPEDDDEFWYDERGMPHRGPKPRYILGQGMYTPPTGLRRAAQATDADTITKVAADMSDVLSFINQATQPLRDYPGRVQRGQQRVTDYLFDPATIQENVRSTDQFINDDINPRIADFLKTATTPNRPGFAPTDRAMQEQWQAGEDNRMQQPDIPMPTLEQKLKSRILRMATPEEANKTKMDTLLQQMEDRGIPDPESLARMAWELRSSENIGGKIGEGYIDQLKRGPTGSAATSMPRIDDPNMPLHERLLNVLGAFPITGVARSAGYGGGAAVRALRGLEALTTVDNAAIGGLGGVRRTLPEAMEDLRKMAGRYADTPPPRAGERGAARIPEWPNGEAYIPDDPLEQRFYDVLEKLDKLEVEEGIPTEGTPAWNYYASLIDEKNAINRELDTQRTVRRPSLIDRLKDRRAGESGQAKIDPFAKDEPPTAPNNLQSIIDKLLEGTLNKTTVNAAVDALGKLGFDASRVTRGMRSGDTPLEAITRILDDEQKLRSELMPQASAASKPASANQIYPGITREASELLEKLDSGSAIMDQLTNNFKRILRENNVTPAQYNAMSAPEAVEVLRARSRAHTISTPAFGDDIGIGEKTGRVPRANTPQGREPALRKGRGDIGNAARGEVPGASAPSRPERDVINDMVGEPPIIDAPDRPRLARISDEALEGHLNADDGLYRSITDAIDDETAATARSEAEQHLRQLRADQVISESGLQNALKNMPAGRSGDTKAPLSGAERIGRGSFNLGRDNEPVFTRLRRLGLADALPDELRATYAQKRIADLSNDAVAELNVRILEAAAAKGGGYSTTSAMMFIDKVLKPIASRGGFTLPDTAAEMAEGLWRKGARPASGSGAKPAATPDGIVRGSDDEALASLLRGGDEVADEVPDDTASILRGKLSSAPTKGAAKAAGKVRPDDPELRTVDIGGSKVTQLGDNGPRLWHKRQKNVPKDAVYVGRPSKWGNPYKIGPEGSRAEVIAKYNKWLDEKIAKGELDPRELKGKDLVDWCAPEPCHAERLMKIANGAEPMPGTTKAPTTKPLPQQTPAERQKIVDAALDKGRKAPTDTKPGAWDHLSKELKDLHERQARIKSWDTLPDGAIKRYLADIYKLAKARGNLNAQHFVDKAEWAWINGDNKTAIAAVESALSLLHHEEEVKLGLRKAVGGSRTDVGRATDILKVKGKDVPNVPGTDAGTQFVATGMRGKDEVARSVDIAVNEKGLYRAVFSDDPTGKVGIGKTRELAAERLMTNTRPSLTKALIRLEPAGEPIKPTIKPKGAKVEPGTEKIKIDKDTDLHVDAKATPEKIADDLADDAEEADATLQAANQSRYLPKDAKAKDEAVWTLKMLRERWKAKGIGFKKDTKTGRVIATTREGIPLSVSITEGRSVGYSKLNRLLEDRYGTGSQRGGGGGKKPPTDQKPPEYDDGGNVDDDIDNIVEQLNNKIKLLGKMREKLAVARSESLRKKIAAGKRAQAAEPTNVGKLEAFGRALAKTVLDPTDEIEGQNGILNLTKDMQERLAGVIIHAPLTELEQKRAGDALKKLTGILDEDGKIIFKIPQRNEIELLRYVFGDRLADTLLKARGSAPLMQFMRTMSIPTALMSSWDLSYPFRQGLMVLAFDPLLWGRMVKVMTKSFMSEEAAELAMKELQAHPRYREMIAGPTGRGGLDIVDWRSGVGYRRAEEYLSDLPEKIPFFGTGIGKDKVAGIRGSNRAFTVAGNYARVHMMAQVLDGWKTSGIKVTPEKIEALANIMNIMTGRGKLGEFTKYAPYFNLAFFAPRFAISRPQLLATAVWNIYKYRNDPGLRWFALRQLGQEAILQVGILTALNLLWRSSAPESERDKFQVELDPRSSDFGKYRVGDFRGDFMGGWQPFVRATMMILSPYIEMARDPQGVGSRSEWFGTGQRKTLGTGEIVNTQWHEIGAGVIRPKASPWMSLLLDTYSKKDFAGRDFDITNPDTQRDAILERTIPMFWTQYAKAVQEEGLSGAILALPAFLGTGASVFNTPEHDIAGLKEYENIPRTVSRFLQKKMDLSTRQAEAMFSYMTSRNDDEGKNQRRKAAEIIGDEEVLAILRSIDSPPGGLRKYMRQNIEELDKFIVDRDKVGKLWKPKTVDVTDEGQPIEAPKSGVDGEPERLYDLPYSSTEPGKIKKGEWSPNEVRNYWANELGKKRWKYPVKTDSAWDAVFYVDLPSYARGAIDRLILRLNEATGADYMLSGKAEWGSLPVDAKNAILKKVPLPAKPKEEWSKMTPDEIVERLFSELEFEVKPKGRE